QLIVAFGLRQHAQVVEQRDRPGAVAELVEQSQRPLEVAAPLVETALRSVYDAEQVVAAGKLPARLHLLAELHGKLRAALRAGEVPGPEQPRATQPHRADGLNSAACLRGEGLGALGTLDERVQLALLKPGVSDAAPAARLRRDVARRLRLGHHLGESLNRLGI